VQFFLYNML